MVLIVVTGWLNETQVVQWQLVRVKVFLRTPWRHTCNVAVGLHSFLTSTLEEGEWSSSSLCHFARWKEIGCHWIRIGGAPESVWTFSRRKISCKGQDTNPYCWKFKASMSLELTSDLRSQVLWYSGSPRTSLELPHTAEERTVVFRNVANHLPTEKA